MKLRRVLAAFGVCLWTAAAHAELGTLDDVPGQILLLPYFEVDLEDANGVDTVLSVHNASAAAIIAHLTMWTDLAIPMLAFDINLTGFDVEEIYLREIFESRYPPPGTPLAGSVARALNGTTGRPVAELGGNCAGASYRDGIARGYVTIDPATTNGAMGSGAGGAAGLLNGETHNVLWGDYRIIQRGDGIAAGELLASLEKGSGGGSFEEPPSTWGVRFLRGGNAVTDLIIWRDFSSANGVTCGPPPIVDEGEDQIVIFDDAENPIEPEQRLPALAASRVRLGTGLDVPFNSGWIFLKLGIGQEATGRPAYVTSLTFGNGGGFAIRGIDLTGAGSAQGALK